MLNIENTDVFKEAAQRLHAERSFHEFLKQTWHLVEGPSVPFIDNWHIQALCEHLEAVHRSEIKNLIINFPPRSCKSTILSVLWPAWVWLQKPEEQFMFASHSMKLCQRDLIRSRWVMESEWYQLRFGDRFQIRDDQSTQSKFTNDRHGYRIATSTRASITGDGGNVLCMDDPNNSKDGESEAEREQTNTYYSSGFSNRGNNPKTVRKIISMQRFHERDVTGYVLSLDNAKDWVKVVLPMEFEVHRRARTIKLPSTKDKVWEDPRTKEGELLWPELYGPKEVTRGKAELGSEYRISSQYQQLPSPSEGGIIKKKWFCWWKQPTSPKLLQVIQSWDTAYETSDTASYSCCTTWGIFNDEKGIANIILLSLYRDRVGYPQLREMAKRLYKDYRDDGNFDITPSPGKYVPDMVIVEAKATGGPLIQDLREAGISATKFNPTRLGDKMQRVHVVTHLIENGRVWVPTKSNDVTKLRKYADLFVEQCAIFPNGESRDIVDTLTQVLYRLKSAGMISNKFDEARTEEVSERNEPFY